MGLFDALSPPTGPIRRAGQTVGQAIPVATQQQVSGLQGLQGTLTDAQKAAIAATQAGTTGAESALQGGLGQGLSYLQGGYGAATGDINQALSLYSPLAQSANQAFNLYGQALSGGPQAQQAFQDFWNSTGAQAELEKGTTGLERMANSRGMLSSGNLTQDEIDYMTNAVRGGYQGWLGDLWNQGALAPGIAGAQSGLYGVLAGLGTGLGTAEASLAGGTAGDIASLLSGQGSNLSNIYAGFAPQIGQTQAQIGQTQAAGTMGGAQNKAQTLANLYNADLQGSQNFLGLIGGLANPLAYLGGKYMATA